MEVRTQGEDKERVRDTPLLSSRVVGIAIALYIALVIAASVYFDISLTIDRVAVLLLIAALGTGRVRAFLKDWSAFILVLLAWQALQGMSAHLTHFKPHVTEMIVFDRFVFFGHLPTMWLQHHFYHPHHIAWYDLAASLLYTMHFVFPLVFAFVLWVAKREVFGQFMGSFMLLALAGFATFVLFPAAPPWMAADWWHYFPHVTRIFDKSMIYFGGEQNFSAITQWIWAHNGYDLVGAVPSEHAAFPFLCFLYARHAWKRAGYVLLPYCLAVGVAVVYIGEHYVFDVVAGITYATLAYAAVQLLMRSRQRAENASAESEQGLPSMSDSLPA